MAVCSLCVAVVYLRSKNKNFWIALIPCMFMAFITSDYILWVSPDNLKGAPLGFGLNYNTAILLAIICAGVLGFFLVKRGKALSNLKGYDADRWDENRTLGKNNPEPRS